MNTVETLNPKDKNSKSHSDYGYSSSETLAICEKIYLDNSLSWRKKYSLVYIGMRPWQSEYFLFCRQRKFNLIFKEIVMLRKKSPQDSQPMVRSPQRRLHLESEIVGFGVGDSEKSQCVLILRWIHTNGGFISQYSTIYIFTPGRSRGLKSYDTEFRLLSQSDVRSTLVIYSSHACIVKVL